MGLCRVILLSSLIGFVSFIYVTLVMKTDVELGDVYNEFQYWGPKIVKDSSSIPRDDLTIREFKVEYDEAFVKDLHERLNKTRFVEPLHDSNFNYGFNGDYLKKVVQYWRHNYYWRKQVNCLNSLPQFKTQIEGLDIHFVHVKPVGSPKIVKQIVLANGWPSNYHQFYKLADLLRKPVNGVAFEIIIPSRPGFGYSDEPKKSGFSIADSVRIYVKLMKRLGHEKFFFSGGDWGAIEAHAIGVLYPNIVEGIHLNMALADWNFRSTMRLMIGAYLPSLIYSDELEAKQFESPKKMFSWMLSEIGYFTIQSTKPDTIGASLIDSPAGLAAYVLEKYSTWVNKDYINLPDGGLTKKLNLDELTNIQIFWQTGNGAYSTRFYKEFSNVAMGLGQDITKKFVDHKVPVGFSIGEHEVPLGKMRPIGKYNIVKFDYIRNVGHFAPFDNPTAFDEHLRKFVQIVLNSQSNQKSRTDL